VKLQDAVAAFEEDTEELCGVILAQKHIEAEFARDRYYEAAFRTLRMESPHTEPRKPTSPDEPVPGEAPKSPGPIRDDKAR
jgi:hypothetical protein